jgi:hypothetical protein
LPNCDELQNFLSLKLDKSDANAKSLRIVLTREH